MVQSQAKKITDIILNENAEFSKYVKPVQSAYKHYSTPVCGNGNSTKSVYKPADFVRIKNLKDSTSFVAKIIGTQTYKGYPFFLVTEVGIASPQSVMATEDRKNEYAQFLIENKVPM